jgi:DNA polymerase (family 10)
MENIEIGRILNAYADLLDIEGENPFRIRSYRHAAQTVEGLSVPIERMIEGGEDVTELPGIGTSMAEHIREILRTGTLSALERLHREYPPTMTDLMRLETLGPKRARQLYDALGITSVGQLAEALEAGSVEKLPGFGKKTAANLRRAIENFERYARRFLLADAEQLVQPLLAHLREASGIKDLEVAGSYRRRKETVGDIDILATCEDPRPVMQHFLAFREVEQVEAAGTTRGTVVLRSGLQVDLRIVPQRSYGAALYYFTGSKAHNLAVRKMGVERGLSINEYGVFRVAVGKAASEGKPAKGRRVGGETEEDVFKAVDLVWVPPELREDRGEIQAAQRQTLPTLITLDDIRGDLQMHSTWSDGLQSIEAMAHACQSLGYDYCAVTDHSQSTRVAGGLDAKAFRKQWKEIESIRRRLAGIVLLKGVELDILADGSLDLPDEAIEGFDIVLISVHSGLNMTRAQMTKRLCKALAHPGVDILAHPTCRQINTREPIDVDLEEVFRVAREHDVAVEVDGQPQRLDLSDVHVHRARELGLKVVIDTDAHSVDQLRFMRYGVDQARRGWLEKPHVLNTLPWPEFRKWLGRRY